MKRPPEKLTTLITSKGIENHQVLQKQGKVILSFAVECSKHQKRDGPCEKKMTVQ